MAQLLDLDFGRGAAQQEENLKDYFYRSGSYQLAASDEIYVVLGAKGAGKSAMFRQMKDEAAKLPLFLSPNSAITEEPLAFRDLWPIISGYTSSYVNLWKLYFASLAAKHILQIENVEPDLAGILRRFLARWGLVSEIPTRLQEWLNIKFDAGWGEVIRTEIPPKRPLAIGEIDAVIIAVSSYFERRGGKLWICLDALDEVSIDSQAPVAIEDLLGDCMKAVGEVLRYPSIRFKLFFRSDIYNRLTYVNKDHFSTSKLELLWSENDLAILLGHRLAPLYPAHQGPLQVKTACEWIDQVFEWGKKVQTFSDLHFKLMDGQGIVLPRDLVQFCIQAKRTQNMFNVQGTNPPGNGKLISGEAVDSAIKATAAAKLTDFLNVFKRFSATLEHLRGHPKRVISRKDLALALGKDEEVDARLVFSDLWQVGVLRIADKLSINRSEMFEIPYLYAEALELGH